MGESEWIHAAIGGVASVIFLFQTLGAADNDTDGDFELDGDVETPSDASVGDAGTALSDFLSVRNFVAFFIGYGWVTLAALLSGLPQVTASALGCAAGVVFVVISLFLIKTFLKFQEDGTLKLERLVGKEASVYITIGEKSSAVGKVIVDTRKGRMELPARTEDAVTLRPGQLVRVVRTDGGILWVSADAALDDIR